MSTEGATAWAGERIDLAGASTVNSYALILRHNQSATATVAPTAYLKIEDDTTTTTANTSFVMDIYPVGPFGVTASATATAGPVSADGTASTSKGWLKVKVLGQTRYISLFSIAREQKKMFFGKKNQKHWQIKNKCYWYWYR